MPQDFSKDYKHNIQLIDSRLRVTESFDIVCRNFEFAKKQAKLYFVDGLVKDDSMVKVIQGVQAITEDMLKNAPTARNFVNQFISYIETDVTGSLDFVTTMVLSGALCIMI
ncbi:MAG: spore germination protein, partial [Clostridia bacterium]|nr:spore germination protein [Clostridia bacterium]